MKCVNGNIEIRVTLFTVVCKWPKGGDAYSVQLRYF